ncbi:MAG: DUF4159 domain-containing protein [Thermoguttaceae bacterium]|nr:DUF4159 domain-containing protein [Thermoguttaceae bacterium]
MRRSCIGAWLAALTWVATPPALSGEGPKARDARSALTPEAVRQAIESGANFLKRQQQANGGWAEHLGYHGGVTALCTLALLNAGVPPDDEHVKRALAYLRRVPAERTYVTSLQTMVFCRAHPELDLPLIQRNVVALERWQIPEGQNRGAWAYPEGPGDNSNSQFALLALYDADRIGVKVSARTWQNAQRYWRQCQNPDGSWGYVRGMAGSGSMTAAGITSMVITMDRLGEPDATVEGDRILPCQRSERGDNPVERAVQWFARNFTVESNPGVRGRAWLLYYLYGLERVGRLTNRRFIGEHDWYREGAEYLVFRAKGGPLSDHWTGTGMNENDARIATSFALLFLSKGRWPVLLSKLRHGREDDWNAHRSDVNNLTRYVESQWKTDLIWQVMDLRASSIDDLTQSPVLYYCGKNSPLPEDPREQDELAAKLRGYLDRGGFLFAEAYCGGAAFDEGFRKLMKKVFPEEEYKLQLLPAEHPIWRAEEVVPAKHQRVLEGVEFGCRTSVVYCPPDHSDRVRAPLSALWELSRPGREVKFSAGVQEEIKAGLSIGLNVLAYATNRELKTRDEFFTSRPEKAAPSEARRGLLYVANLRHPGGCTAAPRALTNLLEAAAANAKIRVHTPPRDIDIGDPALFDYHLVFMHGRTFFRLTDAERKQLKTYVERGGMVLADAICASPQFADAFRKEMQAMFPDRALQPIPREDPMLTTAYGGFDVRMVQRRDPQQRSKTDPLKALLRKVPPELEGIKLDDRWGVVFSRYDLSCALEKQDSVECQGYTREDAARIGVNVVLYSLQQ